MTGQEAALAALAAVGVGLAVAVGGSLVAVAWGLISVRRSRLGSPCGGNPALASALGALFGVVASAVAGVLVAALVFFTTLGGAEWIGGSPAAAVGGVGLVCSALIVLRVALGVRRRRRWVAALGLPAPPPSRPPRPPIHPEGQRRRRPPRW
jgi:hypothetical protein